VVHKNGTGAGDEVSFTAASTGVYSYLWENHGSAPAALEVELHLPPGGRVHSWHPPP